MRETNPLNILRNILPKGLTKAEQLLTDVCKQYMKNKTIPESHLDEVGKYFDELEEQGKEIKGRYSINLAGAICFLIMMQGDGGIMDRSPSYIEEKMILCIGSGSMPWSHLDHHRQQLLMRYIAKWPSSHQAFRLAMPPDPHTHIEDITAPLAQFLQKIWKEEVEK